MEILVFILLLLVLVLLSNIIGHYISFLPVALIQIVVGVVFALLVEGFEIEVETEWFLLLFIAPLLYNDGAHFPREELWKMRASILGNAIILVLLTTIIGGYFVHWLLPMIPLAAAFALAAILSPTDPVAVNGIAKRVHIPEKIMNLVRGESLINDASGLVAFTYAVAAVVTGYFSASEAFLDFLYKFIVGAGVGMVGSSILNWIRYRLKRAGISDVVFHSLLQILTPFLLFYIAEELLHASGVIAVVAGGILHALVKERTENLAAQEYLLTNNIWVILSFVLNGIIFLLLGLTLPNATSTLLGNETISNWLLLLYVVVFGVVILGIRLLWTIIFNRVDYYSLKSKDALKPTFKNDVITTLVGVRGTITMVGVLSVPLVTNTGEVFPARELIVLLAAGVILFTLIIATILLPILSTDQPNEHAPSFDLNEEKIRMIVQAIEMIKAQKTPENAAVAYELINDYNVMLQLIELKTRDEEEITLYEEGIKLARLKGLKLEKQYVEEFNETNTISPYVIKSTLQSIEDRKQAILKGSSNKMTRNIKRFFRKWKRFRLSSEELSTMKEIERNLLIDVYQKVIDYFETLEDPYMLPEVKQNILAYYKRSYYKNKEADHALERQEYLEAQKELLSLQSIEVQREVISNLFNAGFINAEQAKELRRFVNYFESIVLYEYVE